MADEKKAAKKAAKKTTRKAAAKKDTAAKKGAKKPAAGKAAAKPAPKPKKAAPKAAPVVVRASSRYVRVAPRKARLVADQVRGLHIDQARALLEFSPRSVARNIQKLVESAASNAENNHDLIADEMRISEITVDEGPTGRRFRPRARGAGARIDKRTCHIAVALSPEEDF